MNRKKELIWSFITVIIAAISIGAVISRANDFTMEDFFDYVASAHPFWLTMAVVLGTGSTLDKAISVWVTQTFVTIGSGCVERN